MTNTSSNNYIDALKLYPKKRKKYAHLIGTNIHAFANQCGINRCFYHTQPYPHYDVSEDHYLTCTANGAIQVTNRELIQILRSKYADER